MCIYHCVIKAIKWRQSWFNDWSLHLCLSGASETFQWHIWFMHIYEFCGSMSIHRKGKVKGKPTKKWDTFSPDLEIICNISFMSVPYWMCRNFLMLLTSPFSWWNSKMNTTAVPTGNNSRNHRLVPLLVMESFLPAFCYWCGFRLGWGSGDVFCSKPKVWLRNAESEVDCTNMLIGLVWGFCFLFLFCWGGVLFWVLEVFGCFCLFVCLVLSKFMEKKNELRVCYQH